MYLSSNVYVLLYLSSSVLVLLYLSSSVLVLLAREGFLFISYMERWETEQELSRIFLNYRTEEVLLYRWYLDLKGLMKMTS